MRYRRRRWTQRPPPLLPAPPRLLGELKVGRRTSDYPNTHYLESPISISHPQFISGRWWVVLTTLREPQMGNSNCWKRMLWKWLYHFWNFDLFRLVGRVAKVVKLFQYHEFSKRFSKTFLKFDTFSYIFTLKLVNLKMLFGTCQQLDRNTALPFEL